MLLGIPATHTPGISDVTPEQSSRTREAERTDVPRAFLAHSAGADVFDCLHRAIRWSAVRKNGARREHSVTPPGAAKGHDQAFANTAKVIMPRRSNIASYEASFRVR